MRARVVVAIGALVLGSAAAATVALRGASGSAVAARPGTAAPAGAFERVERRTVRLVDAAAARAYAATALSQSGTALGNVGNRQALAGGTLLTAAPCGCHRQVPQFLYVAVRGREVVWLSAEGSTMTPGRVLQLASGG